MRNATWWKRLAAVGIVLAAALVAMFARGGLGAQHAHAGETQAAAYVCPMHPDVTSDKPGVCPKCSMKLEQKPPSHAPRALSPARLVL